MTGITISVILGPLVSWFITHRILDRLEAKRQLKHLRVIMELIDNIYKEYKHDKENGIRFLKQKRVDILALLKGGIISESTYHLLNERIFEHIESLHST